MRSPKIIFLDAVGTIFGVSGSVGEQYAKVAANFNVNLDPELVNRAFYQSFQGAPKIAFPDLPQSDIPIAEYMWWRSLAEQTFRQTGDIDKFADYLNQDPVLYNILTDDSQSAQQRSRNRNKRLF